MPKSIEENDEREQLDMYLERIKNFSSQVKHKINSESKCILVKVLNHLNEIEQISKLFSQSDIFNIAIIGAFSSGKSTIINTFLGQKLVPSKANRSTGVPTSFEYGETLRALYVDDVNQEHELNINDISNYILLTQESKNSPRSVREIKIFTPHPWLLQGVRLWDTPGMVDDLFLDKKTYEVIERSDLVIIVLRADKLLSVTELDKIQVLSDLLSKNILFVINCVDLIDLDEYEEIKDRAITLLDDYQNSFLSNRQIFFTSARTALQYKTKRIRSFDQGFLDFENELDKLLSNNSLTQKIRHSSKVSVLRYKIKQFKYVLESIKSDSQAEYERELKRNIEKARLECIKINDKLDDFEILILEIEKKYLQALENIKNYTVNKSKQLIYQHDVNWRLNINKVWTDMILLYRKNLKNEISAATRSKNIFEVIGEPDFPKIDASFNSVPRINVPVDIATEVSQIFPDALVLRGSRWLGRNLLGTDFAKENLQATVQSTFSCAQKVKKLVQAYFDDVRAIIKSHKILQELPLKPSTSLLQLEERKVFYTNVIEDLSAIELNLNCDLS